MVATSEDYKRLLFGLVATGVFDTALTQGIVPIPQDVKDDIVSRVDAGLNPSIALAAFDSGSVDVYVYGLKNISAGVAATEETVYDIGSISKTFTSLLMGKLFVEQKLHLWDPLDKYFPKDLGLREEDGTPIELLHFANHTSGMPRIPFNIDTGFPEDYGQDDLYEFLSLYQPENVGESYSYSNLGYSALGEALAICQDDGRGLKKIILEDIVEPMGLRMFYEPENEEQKESMAEGYL